MNTAVITIRDGVEAVEVTYVSLGCLPEVVTVESLESAKDKLWGQQYRPKYECTQSFGSVEFWVQN